MEKVIVITGASRGIGFETALQLAESGHTIVAVARSSDLLADLTSQVTNGKIVSVTADIKSTVGIKAIKQAIAPFENVHGLINNAGITIRKSFMDTEISEFSEMMDANFLTAVRMIQMLKPKLKHGSHIVNISSMSGFQGAVKFPGLSAYGASKAALVGLTEVISKEFLNDGISVNCLCIGAVKTEMLAKAFPGYEAPVSARQMGIYLSDFVLNAQQFYNGKILPVALSDPD